MSELDNASLTNQPKLSIIIPIQNEKNNLEALFRGIRSVLTPLKCSYEVLFIDDGSDDGSDKVLEKLHYLYPRDICVITLRHRSGKADALGAAISMARGKWILTMDGDGQDNPSEIPKFLRKMDV